MSNDSSGAGAVGGGGSGGGSGGAAEEDKQKEQQQSKEKKHDSGAADLEKVTDYAEEKEILSTSTDLEDAIAVIREFGVGGGCNLTLFLSTSLP